MSGAGGWAVSLQFAQNLVSQMTNGEKNNITYGWRQWRAKRISLGATWNKDLAYKRAQYLGAEFKAKGANIALGPVVGPIGRVAEGGRNWEGFSNDPYLAGSLVYLTIKGMQESVIACVKHFIANEQETDRIPPGLIPNTLNASTSSNIDDKTMHELYLWPFADAVYAGACAVMCSYNQINGSYGCQNSKAQNGLLKGELGFQGMILSNWGAQHSGVASANAGLDMAMPDSEYWENGNLTMMVNNGSVSQARLDDMATRILASWHRFAQIDEPGFGMPISLLEPHEFVDARDPTSSDTWLQGAKEGHVLVKNINDALPLHKPKFISLFGYDGPAPAVNAPTATEGGFDLWTFGLASAKTILGFGEFNGSYLIEVFLSSAGPYPEVPGIAVNGTLWTGGGSGATTPGVIDTPLEAFTQRAKQDGTYLQWNFYDQDPGVNAASDACVVFINALASEGWDRPNIEDQYSDELVMNVASKCPNTYVVIHNAGVRLVSRWVDNPNITSIIYAHLPGQDSGESLVQLMYGEESFSGRLPYTVGKSQEDYGRLLAPDDPDASTLWHPQSNFTEGVYIDYKHFIAQNITPQYEFGYGLTYTTFSYSDLMIDVSASAPQSMSAVGAEGGDPELWQSIGSISATITNIGDVAAAEVAQLYINIPGGPQKQLRGYSKDFLEPGASCTATFELNKRDLSTWDMASQAWVLQSGEYAVSVGKSVLDIQLHGSITL